MANTLTRTADARARIALPKEFANLTVVVEQVSDTELRIRKSKPSSRRKPLYVEETATRLSDADRDRFLRMLDAPPKPNAALKKAMAKFQAKHG